MEEHAGMRARATGVTVALDFMESDVKCKQGFSGKRCKVTRPCSLGICLNGGTCVDGPYTNSKYGFACVCQQGFDGIACEKRLPDSFRERLAIL